MTRGVVRLPAFTSGPLVLRVDPDTVRWRTLLPGTDSVAGDTWLAGLDRTERREGGLLVGVVETGGGEGGVVVTRALFAFMAGVAGSAAIGSFAKMLRTDDTIFRFPRAVAELTRFRTGSVSLFGGSLLASAGLSDVDFFSDVGYGALVTGDRAGLLTSCWVNGLLLREPVVLELTSVESLLIFAIASPSTLQPWSPTAIVLGVSLERSVCTSRSPSSVPTYSVAPSLEKSSDVTVIS